MKKIVIGILGILGIIGIIVFLLLVSSVNAKEEVIKRWEEGYTKIYEVVYVFEVDLVCLRYNLQKSIYTTDPHCMQCWDGKDLSAAPTGIVDLLKEWRKKKK